MIVKILKKINIFSQKGFGLIEIILVIGVGMATFLGIEQYLNLSLRAALQDSHQTEALYWAKSNLEQARAVRDEDWARIDDDLTIGNEYSLWPNGTIPPVGTTPQYIAIQSGRKTEGRYSVWITTSEVLRDVTSDDIVTGGSTYIDSNTLKINSNVSWSENGATKTVTISEYLVNFK